MKPQLRIQERADQPYLAIPLTVTMEGGFGEEVESGFSELFGWLEEHGGLRPQARRSSASSLSTWRASLRSSWRCLLQKVCRARALPRRRPPGRSVRNAPACRPV